MDINYSDTHYRNFAFNCFMFMLEISNWMVFVNGKHPQLRWLPRVFLRLNSVCYHCLPDVSINRACKNDAINPKKKRKPLQHLKGVKSIVPQGSYRSWKTWEVMEFYNFIFQACKVLKFRCGSWKVMENQYVLYE